MDKRRLMVSVLAGFLALVMILGIVLSAIPTAAGTATESELENKIAGLEDEKKEIDNKLKELEKKYSDNRSDMQAIIDQKDNIDAQIFMLYEQMTNLNEQIATYNLMIADKQDELDAAEATLKALKEKHKERIRTIEEEGGISYWEVLFQAKSFTDLLGRFYMIQEIEEADQRRMLEMDAAAKLVAKAKEELEVEKAALEESKKELEETQKVLEVKRAEADALLADLIATGDEYAELMHEAEKEANRINEELMKAEDELKDIQAAQKPPISSEGWMVPCRYIKLTSAWGYRNNPTGPGTEFHDGVDLANNTGTPIYATRSGTVHGVGYAESGHNLGNYVTLNHGDGFKSQYAHMTYFVVKPGQWVEQGQLIGYMGSTGRSTGPHLHFAIYYNGVSHNPASYMKLPIWP